MKLVNDNLPKDLVLDTYSLPISPYKLVDMCVISQTVNMEHSFLLTTGVYVNIVWILTLQNWLEERTETFSKSFSKRNIPFINIGSNKIWKF